MGMIRGILAVFASILLFLSVIALILCWTLSLSLTYDNVQKESSIIIKDFLNSNLNVSSIVNKNYPFISLYCQNHSDFSYVFNTAGYTFDIPCSIALQGTNAIINEGIKDIINSVYYAKYNCNFIDCIKNTEAPLFLISEKAHNFWNDKFYLSLAISVILLAIIFLLIEKKTNLPILAGIILVISAILFIKIDAIFSLSTQIIFKFLRIFFSQAFFVSIRMLILGILFIVAGIIFKIFKIGFHISNLISKLRGKETKAVKPQNKPQKQAQQKTAKKSPKSK